MRLNTKLSLLLAAVLSAGIAEALTAKATSCVGRCGENDGTTGCQCNVVCSDFGDCCSDYNTVCMSCTDRCGDPYVATAPCHCNSECPAHNNCCSDYDQLCGGSSGGSVTDAELLAITEELSLLDANNVADQLQVDIQGSTTSSDSTDRAPLPLFTSVGSNALTADTYITFEALRDNYEHEESVAEDNTAAEQAEVSVFLDAVMATPLMVRLEQFMVEKNLISGTLRSNIEVIWFTLYSRANGVLGSSGFEHSFIGELDGNSVGGFHNWVSFYREELLSDADYMGYIEYVDLAGYGMVLTSRYTWYDSNKPIGGFYVGTSPEFELALYTLCFFSRPNQMCGVQSHGVEHGIQTYELQSGGLTLVGSAYPAV